MIIKVQNVDCFIEDASEKELIKITNLLSCFAPNYLFTQMYKRKLWNGRVSLLKGNTFPTGLLPIVSKSIKNTKIIDDRNLPNNTILSHTNVPLRDYQIKVVNTCLNNTFLGLPWTRGVIKVPCAGGKTVIAAALIQVTNVPTIFIVDTEELLDQAVETFSRFNLDVGISLQEPRKVTVVTIQSLMNFNHKTNKKTASGKIRTIEEISNIVHRKKKKEIAAKEYLESIEQVFMDEAHGVAASLDQGNMMCKALALMPNAYLRWGLTATPFERDDYSNFLLEGSTGSLVSEVKAKDLIADGYLTPPKITFFKSLYTGYTIPKKYPDSYNYGIVLNNKRNEKIVSEAIRVEKPCVILVTSIQHGKLLVEKFRDKGMEVPFLSGNEEKDYRKQVVRQLREKQIPIAIASRIWNKGVDIPSIRAVILAGGGESTSRLRQMLGRGMRIAPEKDSFEFIDFFDMRPSNLKKQSVIRRMTFITDDYNVFEENF